MFCRAAPTIQVMIAEDLPTELPAKDRIDRLARAESSVFPATEKTAQVRRVTKRNHSERQLVGVSVVFAASNKRVQRLCPDLLFLRRIAAV